MTVQEAGRLGARTTKERRGDGFYRSIGKKGGDTTKRRYGPEYYQRIGRKGGRRLAELLAAGKRVES